MLRFKGRQARSENKLHGHAAVHRKHLPGEVAAGGPGQEQDGAGHVRGLAQAAQRDLLQQRRARLGADPRRHGGLDEAGGDGVDGDAAGRQLPGGGLGEADDAGFARAVVALPGVADQADDGGDVDDAAGLLLEEAAGEGLGEQEGALEVDVQHRIPVGLAHAHQQAVPGDAGVVDQDVHLAGGGEDLLRGGCHAGGVGDVGPERPGPAAQCLDFRHRLGAGFRLQIHPGDVGAGGGQLQGDGLADAAPGPGHHGHLLG